MSLRILRREDKSMVSNTSRRRDWSGVPEGSIERSATDVLAVLKDELKRSKRRDRHLEESAAERGVERYKGPDTTGRGSVLGTPARPCLETLWARPIGVAVRGAAGRLVNANCEATGWGA